MVMKTISSDTNCMKNAARAKSIQDRFSFSNDTEVALKYAMAEIREATKASKTKKCPT